MNLSLLRVELRRLSRNRRAAMFTAILPAFFFLSFSAGAGDDRLSSLPVVAYVMVSMVTYGAMNALFTGGGVIAAERAIGWPRQLRVAGLRPRDYVLTKVAISYLSALPGVVIVLALGEFGKHVGLSAGQLLGVALWVLVGLAPVAALGVAIGYAARPQALQAVFGIGSALLALLGGLWVPASTFPRALRDLVQLLPTYWSADAGRAVLTGGWVGWHGLAVLVVWTAGLTVLAGWLYRRDSLRPASAGGT